LADRGKDILPWTAYFIEHEINVALDRFHRHLDLGRKLATDER